MSTYRHEPSTHTDGLGGTYSVIRVYADDQQIAMLRVNPDGTCSRMLAIGPVFMRSKRWHQDADAAFTAMVDAHMAWQEATV